MKRLFGRSWKIVIERVIQLGNLNEWREYMVFMALKKFLRRQIGRNNSINGIKTLLISSLTPIYYMLHKNPKLIAVETFNLIQHLQALPELAGFYLVGGTALALQLGHRNSIDIDLFSQDDFDENFIMDFIDKKFFIREKI